MLLVFALTVVLAWIPRAQHCSLGSAANQVSDLDHLAKQGYRIKESDEMISMFPSASNSVNFLGPDLKVLDVLLTPENYSYLNEFSACFPNSVNTPGFFLFTPPLLAP